MSRYRLTVDTGGTFSDFVLLDDETGEVRVIKVPSTPDDPSQAILAGLDQLAAAGVDLHEIGFFFHGTTVATNTLLEQRGARVGLAVTQGFRGIYEAMEQSRPHGGAIFDLGFEKPPMLAPQSRTAEIGERVGARGEVSRELDAASVAEAIAFFEAESVEAVAVCFLFSFMNPAHEQRVADAFRVAHPEWWVSVSSDLLPQIREYYRLSTTVINAYVSPILGRYVGELERHLDARGIAPSRRFTMQSNGGSTPFSKTGEQAVATILSGPAGGVSAGTALAAATGIDAIVTFDMGGTSCDVALVHRGTASMVGRAKIAGRDIAIPMLDINTVSAGGGTLAHVDAHGALHLGPRSAGAVPGPVCYGRGGTEPTVADADVVLGYLNPRGLLGGALPIHAGAAASAIRERIARPLGVDLLRAADGMVKVVNVKMAEAIKAISTYRGHDLRDFTLVPFGGAGPVHACQIAVDLGIGRVLVPRLPGVFSAQGLMVSNVKHDHVRSRLEPLDVLSEAEVSERLEAIRAQATDELREEGFRSDEIRLRCLVDMRYEGQGYELSVPIEPVPLRAGDLRRYRASFDDLHRTRHGHAAPDQPVEVVNYRVEAVGVVPAVSVRDPEPLGGGVEAACIDRRPALFTSVGSEPIAVPVLDRDRLRPGHRFDGPAIVEQYDATTVVCPEQAAIVDAHGNLIVSLHEVAG